MGKMLQIQEIFRDTTKPSEKAAYIIAPLNRKTKVKFRNKLKMEDEGCQFQKYGFCKFRELCKKKHFTEICDKLSRCREIKQCQKRHPKNCKRFASGSGCRHDKKCAYNHTVEEMKKKIEILENIVADLTNKEVSKENEKMEQLEVVVKALVRKVLSLESGLKVMKSNKTACHEEPFLFVKKESESEKVEEEKGDKEKKPETTKEASQASSSKKIKETTNKVKDKNKFSKRKDNKVSVFKFGAEARKNVLDGKESEEKETTSTEFKCDLCSYKAQKLKTLKKHIDSKHTEQNCKVCRKEFKTSMELVTHVAKEHVEEEEWNVQIHSTPKSKEKLKSPDLHSTSPC